MPLKNKQTILSAAGVQESLSGTLNNGEISHWLFSVRFLLPVDNFNKFLPLLPKPMVMMPLVLFKNSAYHHWNLQ
jgi:hypothetical protein